MFKDEIVQKFAIKDELIPFAFNMIGRSKAVVSGVKRIVYADENALVLKVGNENLKLTGKNLAIVEIGAGDLYATGKIEEICFEKDK